MNADSESKQDETLTFIPLTKHAGYMISIVYPHQIRRRGNPSMLVRCNKDSNGYEYVYLNGVKHYKHRIIAEQFIPNPEGKPVVDHINHDRSDNHVRNIRWVSYSENNRNLSSKNGIEYEFVDELEANAIQLNFINGYEFEGYWLAGNEILCYNGGKYRKLFKNAYGNQWRVRMIDVDGNSRTLSKRQLDRDLSEEYGKDFNI